MPDPAWNATERVYPEALLHEAFAAQVARDPAAPAVRFRDETLTYAQLDARDGLARPRLVGMGADRSLVAVCMERSIEMVVALHAILRVGGAYVPIDPEYPDERIAFMLDDIDDAHPADAAARSPTASRDAAATRRRRSTCPLDAGRRARRVDLPRRVARRPRLRHLHVRLDRAGPRGP